jgi:hypothetical protein
VPDRILRDEILDSERWLAVDCSAKLAFVACLLKCDAVGNLDAQPLRLYRLWRDFGAGTVEASENVLRQLEAADLVREYLVDKRRFIHIPRFGQRVRYVGSLHPSSPWDSPRDKKSNEEKQEKQTAAKISPGDSPAQVSLAPGDSPALTGCAPAEVKRSEVLPNYGLPTPDIARAHEPQTEKSQTEKPKTVHNNFQNQNQTDPKLPREWWKDDARTDAAGRALQLPAKAGESYPDYRTRLFAFIAQRNRGTDPAPPAPRVRQPPEQILQGILNAAKNHRPPP